MQLLVCHEPRTSPIDSCLMRVRLRNILAVVRFTVTTVATLSRDAWWERIEPAAAGLACVVGLHMREETQQIWL